MRRTCVFRVSLLFTLLVLFSVEVKTKRQILKIDQNFVKTVGFKNTSKVWLTFLDKIFLSTVKTFLYDEMQHESLTPQTVFRFPYFLCYGLNKVASVRMISTLPNNFERREGDTNNSTVISYPIGMNTGQTCCTHNRSKPQVIIFVTNTPGISN